MSIHAVKYKINSMFDRFIVSLRALRLDGVKQQNFNIIYNGVSTTSWHNSQTYTITYNPVTTTLVSGGTLTIHGSAMHNSTISLPSGLNVDASSISKVSDDV